VACGRLGVFLQGLPFRRRGCCLPHSLGRSSSELGELDGLREARTFEGDVGGGWEEGGREAKRGRERRERKKKREKREREVKRKREREKRER